MLRNGGALDGSEVLAVLISRKISFSVGAIILVVNVFTFAVAAFICALESPLYSVPTDYIVKTVIDLGQVGPDQ
ncbi:MAG: YitT family protein [Lysinibacillus sp.]